MIKVIDRTIYNKEKETIKNLIAELFKNDNDIIANLEETMEHLDFIFSQEKNKSFLLLNIENNKLVCMVNFLEYNNVLKDWCLFSVFTKKEKRKKGYAEKIIKKGIEIVKDNEGNRIIAGIEYDNIPSEQLHEKLGFKYDGLDWDEIDDGFPEKHKAYIWRC